MKYPGIVFEAEAAMRAVVPYNRVTSQLTPKNYYEVHAYSKSWPCLFPQHGPGRKHTRSIALAGWQQELVELVPALLLRGLIHSDGCRFINTGRGGWSCFRYGFSNLSPAIRSIFCDTCDALGLRWTRSGDRTIYVSRKADVAALDLIVGPKQ